MYTCAEGALTFGFFPQASKQIHFIDPTTAQVLVSSPLEEECHSVSLHGLAWVSEALF